MLGVAAAVSCAAYLVFRTQPTVSQWVSASPVIWSSRVLANWLIWTLGAYLADVKVGRARLPGSTWLPVLGLGLIAPVVYLVVLQRGGSRDPIAINYLWTSGLVLIFAGLLIGLPAPVARRTETVLRRIRFTGTISYSLYLLHYPLLALLSAWWLASHDHLPLGLELVVPGILGAFLLATSGWWLVERHFAARRREVVPAAGRSRSLGNAGPSLAAPRRAQALVD
jgi:peptidoglycan/LPS O-acetylase OafA/YrhL